MDSHIDIDVYAERTGCKGSDMLRPTDRLRRLCRDQNFFVTAGPGFDVLYPRSHEWSELTEIEFIPEKPSWYSWLYWKDSVNPVFPSGFRWEAFLKCWSPCAAGAIYLSTPDAEVYEARVPVRDLCLSRSWCLPGAWILWLSDTIFLSLTKFSLRNQIKLAPHLYQYQVSFSRERGYYVYSILSFTARSWEEAMGTAHPSEIPLHFFHHVTAGLPNGFFSDLELSGCQGFLSPRLCTLFLSLIKSSDNMVEREPQSTIRFLTELDTGCDKASQIRESQLVVIMEHHYNAQVKLELGTVGWDVPKDRVNQLLRESQHLRHLTVPDQMINFDSTDPSFTSNPHFLSLEIPKITNGKISMKLMDGLALNTGVRDFVITFSVTHHEPFMTALLETLTYLFGRVLPRCRSLSTLTLASQSYGCDSSTRQRQDAFCEEIVRCMTSSTQTEAKDRFGSLWSIKITRDFYGFKKKRVLRPSSTWDRLVSPSLVLTWSRRQRNEHSAHRRLPLGLIAAAVRQINHNVMYRKTSDVAPHDSRTANAGAIYDFICCFHPALGIQIYKSKPRCL
jgi:hypothetical protein